jgi:hypothetical protein
VDIDVAIEEVTDLALSIIDLSPDLVTDDEVTRLVELTLAIDQWFRNGGYRPAAWLSESDRL